LYPIQTDASRLPAAFGIRSTAIPIHSRRARQAKIDYSQAYLRDVWTEVSRMKQQGVPAEDAAKRADLTEHKDFR
jgi:hypothetical protein